MITVRTMKQMKTARTLLGFRSGGSRQSLPLAEQSRVESVQAQCWRQELRRQHLEAVWQQRGGISRR